MNLLYFIVGDSVIYHNQCYFSILSFLKTKDVQVYVYTDNPQYYKVFGDKIKLVVLNENQLNEWRGESNFFWRVKIKVIEHLSQQSTSPLIYLDTDTFSYNSPQVLMDSLHQGKAFMHKDEGALKNMKFTPYKMWKQIEGKTFGGITITENIHMWNAGLIGVPVEKQTETLQLALSICDDMCTAGVTPRLIEQYALSVALYTTYGLNSAEKFVGHYWGNKDGWQKDIDKFINSQYLKNNTLNDSINDIEKYDFYATPIVCKIKSIKEKVPRLLDKWFPNYTEKLQK